MKFDMGQAWNDAVSLLRANGQVVTIIAGVFFFLPNVALMMMLPGVTEEAESRVAGGADPEAALQAIGALYGQIWWQILLVSLITAIGMLGMLALLTDRGRPTVGEALKSGLVYLLPYIGSQLVVTFLIVLMALVLALIAGVAGTAAGALLGIAAVVAAIYIYVKFSLTVPVIVVDKVANPVRALGRSWALTKGNSIRLFVFYLLLFVALVVIALVIGLVAGILGALTSPVLVSSLFNAAINAIAIVVFVAVIAAIHRQLSGGPAETPGETFE